MYFPNEKCETSIYIVGQVLDYSEKDVIGYVVKLTGVHAGKELNKSSETGSMQVFGDSGFGFVLPNQIEKMTKSAFSFSTPPGPATKQKKLSSKSVASAIRIYCSFAINKASSPPDYLVMFPPLKAKPGVDAPLQTSAKQLIPQHSATPCLPPWECSPSC